MAGKTENISSDFKKLGILKLDDLLYQSIAKFIWEYENNLLPESFNNFIQYVRDSHSRETRQATHNLFRTNTINTETFGRASLSYHGSMVGNEVKELIFFSDATSIKSFSSSLKQHLLAKY